MKLQREIIEQLNRVRPELRKNDLQSALACRLARFDVLKRNLAVRSIAANTNLLLAPVKIIFSV